MLTWEENTRPEPRPSGPRPHRVRSTSLRAFARIDWPDYREPRPRQPLPLEDGVQVIEMTALLPDEVM